ncbi:MAG: hypothetical protein OEL85_07695 [Desulfobulbaceae bacterium]|nr:hypothetical protein [Desulfobulbaceae bacterium]
MKKRYILFLGLIACVLFAFNANAATIDQTTAGDEVSIQVNTTLIPGAPDPFTFTPSPQVNVSGASVQTCFAVHTMHQLAAGKENGRMFGMAADSATVFWADAPAGDYTDIVVTNSLAFAAYNRN